MDREYISGKEAFQSAIGCLCDSLQEVLHNLSEELQIDCQEIRLRKDLPLMITCSGGPYFFSQSGQVVTRFRGDLRVVTRQEMEESFRILCEDSVYSHQNEIVQGFLSTAAGHRAGICGTAVLEKGKITSLRNITSINLRIARNVPNCADALFRAPIWSSGGGILLVGAPSSGKTTLLRDIGVQLSTGERGIPLRVAVVDERGELGGFSGKVGLCDILRGYPKAEGILQALRSLSPQVILCDEVSTKEEIERMAEGMNSGCRMIVTAHASSAEDFLHRPACVDLLRTGAFQYVVFLRGQSEAGQIQKIWKAEELLDEMDRSDLCFGGRVPVGVSPIPTVGGSGDVVEEKHSFRKKMGDYPAIPGDPVA